AVLAEEVGGGDDGADDERNGEMLARGHHARPSVWPRLLGRSTMTARTTMKPSDSFSPATWDTDEIDEMAAVKAPAPAAATTASGMFSKPAMRAAARAVTIDSVISVLFRIPKLDSPRPAMPASRADSAHTAADTRPSGIPSARAAPASSASARLAMPVVVRLTHTWRATAEATVPPARMICCHGNGTRPIWSPPEMNNGRKLSSVPHTVVTRNCTTSMAPRVATSFTTTDDDRSGRRTRSVTRPR